MADTNWAPIPKVTGGALGGAATTIVLWLVETYGHLELPVAVSAAVSVLVTVGLAYVIPGARAEDNREL